MNCENKKYHPEIPLCSVKAAGGSHFLLFVATQWCSGLEALGTLHIESWQDGCVKYQKNPVMQLLAGGEKHVGLMGSERGGRGKGGVVATLSSHLF